MRLHGPSGSPGEAELRGEESPAHRSAPAPNLGGATGPHPGHDPRRGFDPSNLAKKLKDYALNADNPKNRGKAAWFKNVLGFDQRNWKELADQIYFDERSAVKRKLTPYGHTYRQPISIDGANSRSVNVDF